MYRTVFIACYCVYKCLVTVPYMFCKCSFMPSTPEAALTGGQGLRGSFLLSRTLSTICLLSQLKYTRSSVINVAKSSARKLMWERKGESCFLLATPYSFPFLLHPPLFP